MAAGTKEKKRRSKARKKRETKVVAVPNRMEKMLAAFEKNAPLLTHLKDTMLKPILGLSCFEDHKKKIQDFIESKKGSWIGGYLAIKEAEDEPCIACRDHLAAMVRLAIENPSLKKDLVAFLEQGKDSMDGSDWLQTILGHKRWQVRKKFVELLPLFTGLRDNRASARALGLLCYKLTFNDKSSSVKACAQKHFLTLLEQITKASINDAGEILAFLNEKVGYIANERGKVRELIKQILKKDGGANLLDRFKAVKNQCNAYSEAVDAIQWECFEFEADSSNSP